MLCWIEFAVRLPMLLVIVRGIAPLFGFRPMHLSLFLIIRDQPCVIMSIEHLLQLSSRTSHRRKHSDGQNPWNSPSKSHNHPSICYGFIA